MNVTGQSVRTGYNFNTFSGVFLPSILGIIGVVMFLRLGTVIGEVGIAGALTILAVAEAIALLTGLSVAALSTNTPVAGGGPYFLISRTLGPGFGAALGLVFFFSQSVSVAFYITGFTDVLGSNFASCAPYQLYIGFGILILLTSLSLKGADCATKAQYLIFGVLLLSIVVMVAGAFCCRPSAGIFQKNLPWPVNDDGHPDVVNICKMFAVFFPAVTGFLAGLNMSGDLADSGRSIPRGTILAILAGALIYLLEILLFGSVWSRDRFCGDDAYFQLLKKHALFGAGFLITLGAVAATLSSALGTLLGAPRVLQALSRDKLLRGLSLFERGYGKGNDPVPALLLTFAIAGATVWYANIVPGNGLNAVAELVTLFSLFIYAIINISAAMENFAGNPSYRPRFRYFHWSFGLVGAFLSLGAAVMIAPKLTVAAALVIVVLFFIGMKTGRYDFADARRGFYFEHLRLALARLAVLKNDPKNWRPQMVVMCGNPAKHRLLLRFAAWLNNQRGILSVFSIVAEAVEAGDVRRKRQSELSKLADCSKNYESDFYPSAAVVEPGNLDLAFNVFLQVHTLGPLAPNIVLCGWPGTPERYSDYCRHLRMIQELGMNTMLLLNENPDSVSTIDNWLRAQKSRTLAKGTAEPRTIDIWWRGRKNGALMLTLAYLLSRNRLWRKSPIRLLRLASSEQREEALQELRTLSEMARINTFQTVVPADAGFEEAVRRESAGAAVIFLGFNQPQSDEEPEFFQRWNRVTAGLPPVFLVSSVGDSDLNS